MKIGNVQSPTVMLNATHGTLFGRLAFIVHLGDFSTPAQVEDFIYVDDTSCCCPSKDILSHDIQFADDYTMSWAKKNDMHLNASKTKEIIFLPRLLKLSLLRINDTDIDQVQSTEILGVTLSSNLLCNAHIESTVKRCNQRMYLCFLLKRSGIPAQDLLTV